LKTSGEADEFDVPGFSKNAAESTWSPGDRRIAWRLAFISYRFFPLRSCPFGIRYLANLHPNLSAVVLVKIGRVPVRPTRIIGVKGQITFLASDKNNTFAIFAGSQAYVNALEFFPVKVRFRLNDRSNQAKPQALLPLIAVKKFHGAIANLTVRRGVGPALVKPDLMGGNRQPVGRVFLHLYARHGPPLVCAHKGQTLITRIRGTLGQTAGHIF
jgi:hypothetical protein